jgi:hypothetical protein
MNQKQKNQIFGIEKHSKKYARILTQNKNKNRNELCVAN